MPCGTHPAVLICIEFGFQVLSRSSRNHKHQWSDPEVGCAQENHVLHNSSPEMRRAREGRTQGRPVATWCREKPARIPVNRKLMISAFAGR